MLSKSQTTLLFIRRVGGFFRTLTAEAKIVEENAVEPVKKKTVRKKTAETRRSKELAEYFDTPERRHVLSSYPDAMLRKKTKNVEDLYNTSEKAARTIVDHLKKDLPEERPIIECFPGEGHITQLLINETPNKILLFEPESKFKKNVENIIKRNSDRDITYRNVNLTSLWKFAMIDKLDQGTRVEEALKDVPKRDYEDEPNVRIFMPTNSLPFIKHLIYAMISQNSLVAYGRCELFMCLPPPLCIHLTCSRDAGYMMYRSTSVLFQTFFEHEFICNLNRKDFLPWQVERKQAKYAKIQKFTTLDPESIYLVKFVPKRNLFKFLLQENLAGFWFFVKQHFMSRKNRVIPTMERWIPNCGPRLIVNPTPSVEPKLMNPSIDLSTLPPLSKPCYELSNQDFYNDCHIFTEFGDLTPNQALSLFDRFINWPEFNQCSFSASLESALVKMHSTQEEAVESRGLVEEVEEEEGKTQ